MAAETTASAAALAAATAAAAADKIMMCNEHQHALDGVKEEEVICGGS
jgi:hypothetical protein